MLDPVLSVGEPDGVGRFGVLDIDDDGLLCHECGVRFLHLGLHVWRAHGITARAYRLAHGLARTRGLVAEPLRARLAENARDRLDAKPRFLAARSPQNAAAAPREISPAGREALRVFNSRRGTGRLGTVVICERCAAAFCPLEGARRRRFCSRSCASAHSRAEGRRLQRGAGIDNKNHDDDREQQGLRAGRGDDAGPVRNAQDASW